MSSFFTRLKFFSVLCGLVFIAATTSAQFYKVSLVKDIRPGSGSSNPTNLAYCNGKIYFSANNGTIGYELWTSDGTAATTALVQDINNVSNGSSNPKNLTAVNTTLYFNADDGTHGKELWKYQTAGAGMGAYLVKDINTIGSTGSNPFAFKNLNGTLLFSAHSSSDSMFWELWESNGTSVTTQQVQDVQTFIGIKPSELVISGSKLFFNSVRYNKNNLMSYDLTNVKLESSSEYFDKCDVNGTLFVKAYPDPINVGIELYRLDAAGGMVIVKDIFPGLNPTYPYPNSSNPTNMTNVNGMLFFTATTATGKSLWKSNGTEAGTVIVKDIPGSDDFNNLCDVNGTLYFTVTSTTYGNELWKSNGTTAGTVLVKDIFPGIGNATPENLIDFNGVLYFSANDGVHGSELWRSDGSPDGTVMVTSGSGTSPGNFAVAGDELYFSADDNSNGRELWKVKNCTAVTLASAGISMVQDIVNPFFYTSTNCNNLIATVKSQGNTTPIVGSTSARLWIDATIPRNYAKRHYEIVPAADTATATGRVTLYFTQQDFTDFNTQNTLDLPTGPTDNAGKANLRVVRYIGNSTDGSGDPATYSGNATIINPADADIVWNAVSLRWEVTFDAVGFGGFIVNTRTTLLPFIYTFTGTGNWNVAASWISGTIPPPTLSGGSEIKIDPASGSCILNQPYTVAPGAKLTVKTGKKFEVNGNLTIAQ